MNHRTVLCEASNSTASSGWATSRPVTEAMTAISAMQTAIRRARRCRASWDGRVARVDWVAGFDADRRWVRVPGGFL